MPTRNEWVSFNSNSTTSTIGTWNNVATNYGAARLFIKNGNTLTFPSAGYRYFTNGSLTYRANRGHYWSSTELPTGASSYDLYILVNQVSPNDTLSSNRILGMSIRCISEN